MAPLTERRRLVAVRLAALAAVLFLLAVSVSWGSAGKASGSPTLTGGGHGRVIAVSCGAPGNCAAGGYYTDRHGHEHAFVVDETNGRWGTAIGVPGTARFSSGGGAEVKSVSCAAAGECVAGGFYGNGTGKQQAFVVNETEGRWGSAIAVPGLARLNTGGNAVVNSISCGAAGECAAGGTYEDGPGYEQAFVVDATNGSWGNAIKVPGTRALNRGGDAAVNSISCAGAGKCAAGGYYRDGNDSAQPFVVSETSGSWGKAIRVPGMAALNTDGDAHLNAISCAAAGECAAGGYYTQSGNVQAFVVSERNGAWRHASEVQGSVAYNVTTTAVNSVACAATGECVAGGYAGDNAGGSAGPEEPFLVDETKGTWGTAIRIAGTLTTYAAEGTAVDSISCGAVGNCAAGGFFTEYASRSRAFVVGEKKSNWRTAIQVPGTEAIHSHQSDVDSLSCAAAGDCAAGGYVTDPTFGQLPFVVSEAHGRWGHATEIRLPVTCVVPKLVGHWVGGAKQKLNAANCGVGKITPVYSKLPEGQVAGQDPPPGTALSARMTPTVALAVSRGIPPSAPSHAKTHWRATAAPLPANAATGQDQSISLSSISCVSSGSCTAVGSYYDDAGNREGLLLTEKAGHWETGVEAMLPANAGADPNVRLTSVSCASAGNCTAVGTYVDGALLLTEKAGHWGAGVKARSASALNSVSCASPGNCTAVGFSGGGGVLLTEKAGHWAGGVVVDWASDLTSVSCAPDGGCSAVGYDRIVDGRDYYYGIGVLLTKQRGKWRQVDAVMPGGGTGQGVILNSVSCVSGGNCSAGGLYSVGNIDGNYAGLGVLLTEKAGKWRRGVVAMPPRHKKSPYWGDYVGLAGISCSSPGDCVAMGNYVTHNQQYHLTLLTEKAGTWRRGVPAVLPRGAVDPDLSAVSCASPGNCTVVGSYLAAGHHGFLLTEIGGRWGRGVTAPRLGHSTDSVLSVSCTAPGRCGAVGVDQTSRGLAYGVLFDSTTDPCVVPNVTGETLPRARHSIESHGCSVGTIHHAPSSTTETGRVISQALQPGRHRPPGTKVDLTVSSGP